MKRVLSQLKRTIKIKGKLSPVYLQFRRYKDLVPWDSTLADRSPHIFFVPICTRRIEMSISMSHKRRKNDILNRRIFIIVFVVFFVVVVVGGNLESAKADGRD